MAQWPLECRWRLDSIGAVRHTHFNMPKQRDAMHCALLTYRHNSSDYCEVLNRMTCASLILVSSR